MPDLELYGTAGCPYTRDMREWLEWNGRPFVEYDVEVDAGARQRMRAFGGGAGARTVPLLVKSGLIVQVGWLGRGCVVSLEDSLS